MSANNNDTDDEHLFRSFVADVTPIQTHTVAPKQTKPRALIKPQRNLNASIAHANKVSTTIAEDSFFAFHLSKKKRKEFKAGRHYFDATLDLHGRTVNQSERLLSQFINDCLHQHISHAIIVHGQGHHSEHGSVLKPAVLYWLSCQESIVAFCPAQPHDGGYGASYVLISAPSMDD